MKPRGGALVPWATLMVAALTAACDRDGREAPGQAGPEPAAAVPAPVEGAAAQAPAAVGGIPSIIELWPTAAEVPVGRPDAGHAAAPARGDAAVVDQFGLTFSPRLLVVAAGEPVRFTNSEGGIAHNVRLRSIDADSSVFNGDTGPSEAVDVPLPEPGGYDILCDMHPGMLGFLFVTEAPYALAAEPDGSVRLPPLADGRYRVRVWTVDGGWTVDETVELPSDGSLLDLTAG